MGKVRVQDLARMMGISNQDLVFKLKSIGARVEGDDAHIDTDIISAILAGKKMPHPREVILRDAPAAPESPAAARRRMPVGPPVRRPPTNPLRPVRPRSLIQKVEPRIQTLPASERPAPASAPPLGTSSQTAGPAPHFAAQASGAAGATLSSSAGNAGLSPGQAPGWDPARSDQSAPGSDRSPARPVETSLRPGTLGARPGAAAALPQVRSVAPGGGAGGGAAASLLGTRSAPGVRPGAGGAARPASAAAPATAEDALRRRERIEEAQKAEKAKKKAKGGKKPGPRTPEAEDLKAYQGTIEDIDAAEEDQEMAGGRRRRRAQRKEEEEKEGGKILAFKKAPPLGTVMIGEGMTLREFAEKLGVKARDLIKALFDRGIMANINQVIEPDLAQQLAQDLGVETMVVSFEEEVQLREELEGTRGARPVEGKAARGPVVTIMGPRVRTSGRLRRCSRA